MSAIKCIESAISMAKILPDSEGRLIRESNPFQSGRYKGETKQFIVVELTIIPKEITVQGRKLRVGGRQTERVITTVWEHRHSIDFNDIVDNDLETLGVFNEEKGDYIAKTNQAGEYKALEIGWAAEGAYYRIPCPKYTDGNGNEWNSVSFYLLAAENTGDQAVMTAYKRQCEAVGAVIEDDFDTAAEDTKVVEEVKEQTPPVQTGSPRRQRG